MFDTDVVETPDENDPFINKLLHKVGAHTPVYLDVEQEPGAQINDCFPAVQKKVLKSGGRIIKGWQIWKSSNMVEAEFHAVWEDPDEELHDITPKGADIKRIMFVEDENLVYDGKQVGNILLNTTTNPLVDDFIKLNEAVFRFQNKGELASLYDMEFTETPDEEQQDHFEYLQQLRGKPN